MTDSLYLLLSKHIHECTRVHQHVQNGVEPVSWRFVVARPSTSACSARNYFKTNPIAPVAATRPGQPSITSATRINAHGDYDLRWSATSGAVAYAVTAKTYTYGAGETAYYTTLRGKRSNTNSAIIDTNNREAGLPRFFAVNAANSAGVWSYTPDVVDYSGAW